MMDEQVKLMIMQLMLSLEQTRLAFKSADTYLRKIFEQETMDAIDNYIMGVEFLSQKLKEELVSLK